MTVSLTVHGGTITAAAESRTLSGVVVKWGSYGLTSRGRLRVAPHALRFPDDLGTVKLTREHKREESRGHLTRIEYVDGGVRASCKVADGPEGDAALREAQDRTRDGLSYDIVNATIEGDTITSGDVVAIGQVGIPAHSEGRIDTVAASIPNPGAPMTDEQRARLRELVAKQNMTDAERAEFDTLQALAVTEATAEEETAEEEETTQTTAVAASLAAVPAGVPAPTRAATRTRARSALREVVKNLTAAMAPGGTGYAGITAALSDVIHTDHTGDIEPVQWSGELWSGLKYQPLWSDLFTSGPLTYWEGSGWRFLTTPSMAPYTGDKDEIPSGPVTTEDSSWTAAREAVGVDIDRKFYDFPNEAFIAGLLERIRETWEIRLDAHVKAYVLAQVVTGTRTATIGKTNADATITAATGTFRASDVGATITGSGIPASTTILSVTNSGSAEMSANATNGTTVTATIGAQEGSVLKAAARARMIHSTNKTGTPDWLLVNDQDMFSLMDVTGDDVPAYLELWGIDPKDFRSSPDVPPGSVLAGVRQAATVRTLPGSPIRVNAQNLAMGGVDEAFFGYWAIEEHHTSGIVSVKFNPAA